MFGGLHAPVGENTPLASIVLDLNVLTTRKVISDVHHKIMKLTLIVTAFALQALPLFAQNHQYLLSWRGTAYSTNSAGRVVATRFSERDIIKTIAENNGITDLRDLGFVYRADKRDTAVVRLSDGSIVSDWQQIQYSYTDVTDSNGAYTAKQAFLNDEYHDQAIGSLFGLENWRRNSSGSTVSYSFRGSFQFALPETGTVYSGTFSTGRRVVDKSEP